MEDDCAEQDVTPCARPEDFGDTKPTRFRARFNAKSDWLTSKIFFCQGHAMKGRWQITPDLKNYAKLKSSSVICD